MPWLKILPKRLAPPSLNIYEFPLSKPSKTSQKCLQTHPTSTAMTRHSHARHATLLHPHWEPMESPRVSPTPLGSLPPRVHTTTNSLTAPGTLPTHAPSSIQKSLFPPDVSSVGPRQNIAKQQLGTAPRFPTNSNISHSGIPTPTAPISCHIMSHVPSSPLTNLHRRSCPIYHPPHSKTFPISTNSGPGNTGQQDIPGGWSCTQHPQSNPGPYDNSRSCVCLHPQLRRIDKPPCHGLPRSTTAVPLQYAPRCP